MCSLGVRWGLWWGCLGCDGMLAQKVPLGSLVPRDVVGFHGGDAALYFTVGTILTWCTQLSLLVLVGVIKLVTFVVRKDVSEIFDCMSRSERIKRKCWWTGVQGGRFGVILIM